MQFSRSIDAARIPSREKPTAIPLLANLLIRSHYETYGESAKGGVQHLQRLDSLAGPAEVK